MWFLIIIRMTKTKQKEKKKQTKNQAEQVKKPLCVSIHNQFLLENTGWNQEGGIHTIYNF